MAKEFSRTDRVGDAIKRLLATMIQQEVSDPRVGMVNVNDVVVSRDLSLAKVYITFVDRVSNAQCEEASAALNNAAGYLRSLLAKQLNIRTTPRLQFFYDKTPKQGQHLSSLIDKAVAEDQSRHDQD